MKHDKRHLKVFCPKIIRLKMFKNQSSSSSFIRREVMCLQMCRLIHRKKTIRMSLKIFITATLVTLWLMGSSLLIQIDSDFIKMEFARSQYKEIQEKLAELSKNVDRICKMNLRKQVAPNKTTEEQMLINAVKAKTLKENLLFFPDLAQMWCLVPKAASTSWSRVIINALNAEETRLFLDDVDKTTVPSQVVLKQNYGFISKKIYDGALYSKYVTKILLVRHPFERIVSAYENKLNDRKARKDGMYFFQHFGVKINRKFRKNKKLKKKEPTFAEFVQYLINTDPGNYDEHWKPISLLCGLCQVKYDFIIKVEDLQTLSDYYLQQLNFVSKNVTEFPHENKYNGIISNRSSNYANYFRNIPNDKISQLYWRFQDDFHLFQYSFLDFFVSLRSTREL